MRASVELVHLARSAISVGSAALMANVDTHFNWPTICTFLQVSGSGRKIGVNQTLGILLRRGDLIAYQNGKSLGTLCEGLTGSFV